MRHLWMPLVAAMLGSSITGCSVLISQSGIDLKEITTKEQMQQKFGPPTKTSESDGLVCETYLSRWRFRESAETAKVIGILDIYTLGLAELFFFSESLIWTGKTFICGQELNVTYGVGGRIWKIEGESIESVFPRPKEDTSSALTAPIVQIKVPEPEGR